MKSKFLKLILIATVIFNYSCNESKSEKEIFISDLMSKMTLDEKVGQMNQYNGFWDATGPLPKKGYEKGRYDDLRNGLVGSMLNVTGVKNVSALQKIAVEETRLGIPLIFGFDVIHGYKTLVRFHLLNQRVGILKQLKSLQELQLKKQQQLD